MVPASSSTSASGGCVRVIRTMEKGRLLVCVLALTASVIAACESLKIAAFNVQVFGQKKFARAEVVAVLSQVNQSPVTNACIYIYYISPPSLRPLFFYLMWGLR